MLELDPKQFHPGLVVGNREEDFFAGANSPIPLEARNLTGNWTRFRSKEEDQYNWRGDWYNCTNNSSENEWEAQANWALENNLWPETALTFWNDHGYIVDGKFRISTRFNSKLSGTRIPIGNYLYKAQDSYRKHGVVPEEVWPTSPEMRPDIYYADVPDSTIALGQASLKHYDWLYEFIMDLSAKNLNKHLQHAPIQLGIATCPGWESGKVNACSMQANHAVLLESINATREFNILDHYQPYTKKLAMNYTIASACKGILYPKGGVQPATQDIIAPLTKDIKFGDSGEEVAHLKRALKKLGWLPDYRYDPGILEIYDAALCQVVFNFQLANVSRVFFEMLFSLKGKSVGSNTRAAINEAIKYRK